MSPGSFGFASVHLGTPSVRYVHSGSLGLPRSRLAVAGSVGFMRVHCGAHRGRTINLGSRGFILARIGFIRVRVCSLRHA